MKSLSLAYNMKRKKMARGGKAEQIPGGPGSPSIDKKKAEEMEKGATASGWDPEGWKKNVKEGLAGMYAEGGQIKNNHQPVHSHTRPDLDHELDMESGYVDHMGNDVKHNHAAMAEDERRLGQHGAKEQGPYGTMMAEGGQIEDGHQDELHMMDMVGRIMKQRQQHFSKGGRVANSGMGKLSVMADSSPNNFDDLSLRDDLEFAYTGANSGDERGNSSEDHDRADIVARIMASRRKKDRMPRPA